MEENKAGIGFLLVQATMGNQAYPINDAIVSVAEAGKEVIIYQARTDLNGETERMELPSGSAESSRNPNTVGKGYYIYDVSVTKPGFRNKIFRNVPIFEGQTSLQLVRMQPVGLSGKPDEEVVDTVEPNL